MPTYRVHVILEMKDTVEADSPEEAFEIVSDYAMGGGSWDYTCEEVESDD